MGILPQLMTLVKLVIGVDGGGDGSVGGKQWAAVSLQLNWCSIVLVYYCTDALYNWKISFYFPEIKSKEFITPPTVSLRQRTEDT